MQASRKNGSYRKDAIMLPSWSEADDVYTAFYKLIFPGMPRIVPDQKSKFDNDEFFRKLSCDNVVQYTGYREKSLQERQRLFKEDLSKGFTDITITNLGVNFRLILEPYWSNRHPNIVRNSHDRNSVEFSDQGKVLIQSCFIMNGVCVFWRGSIDMQSLEGVGRLEYDDETAEAENRVLCQQLEEYNFRYGAGRIEPRDVDVASTLANMASSTTTTALSE